MYFGKILWSFQLDKLIPITDFVFDKNLNGLSEVCKEQEMCFSRKSLQSWSSGKYGSEVKNASCFDVYWDYIWQQKKKKKKDNI